MKIIILSISPYKEKDIIVNAISEIGLITFKANGVLSPNHPNAAINNELTIVDVVLNESKNHKYTLKECSIILSPLMFAINYETITIVNAIKEATIKMLDDEEKPQAYHYLETALYRLKEGERGLIIFLSYLIKLMKIVGLELEINHCVRCDGKKDIKGFSLIEGGFICSNCHQDDNYDFTGNTMMIYRLIAGSRDMHFKDLNVSDDELKVMLNKTLEFISDSHGVNIASIKLI